MKGTLVNVALMECSEKYDWEKERKYQKERNVYVYHFLKLLLKSTIRKIQKVVQNKNKNDSLSLSSTVSILVRTIV